MDAQEEKLARIPGTTVERVGDDTLLVHFDSDVLFAVDSASLTAPSRQTLEEVAAVLTEYSKTAVVVQGHTDSTGGEEHNQSLSERRAAAVRGYLIGRGVDAGRLAAVGYGEDMPVASNASAAGRQQNRRVDVLLKARAV
jgi:outer membrane protein OmpA-like peptidoglycan-associated protein